MEPPKTFPKKFASLGCMIWAISTRVSDTVFASTPRVYNHGMRCLPLLVLLACGVSPAQTICIDPGHPSEVGRGTQGKRITEMRAVWLVAGELRALLEKDGLRVVLTKTKEAQFVRNRDRARIANEAGADLLLRLHCDAASGSGLTVYYPDRTGTAADGKKGPSADVLASSKAAAQRFQSGVSAGLKGVFGVKALKTDRATAVGGKQGALTGSIYSQVPVVLVELCVLTNPKDEAFISSKEGRGKLVAALARGVREAVGR